MAEPVNDTTAFRVHSLEPTAWMVWRKPDSTWSWQLTRTGNASTRVVTRLKRRYDLDRPGPALVSVFLMEFGDFPMMRHLLLGLKRRADHARVPPG